MTMNRGKAPLPDHPEGLASDASTVSKTARDVEALEAYQARIDALPPLTSIDMWHPDYTFEPEAIGEPMLHELPIRLGELCAFGSWRGTGKTWAAMTLATILARGPKEYDPETSWLGYFKPTRRFKVAYFHGELRQDKSLVDRWSKLHAPINTRQIPKGHLVQFFPPKRDKDTVGATALVKFGVVKRRLRGRSTDETEEIVEAAIDPRFIEVVESGMFDVIFIDPYRAFLSFGENDNDAQSEVLTELQALAQANDVAIVFVLHTSKSGDRYADPFDAVRGAGTIMDRCRSRIVAVPYWVKGSKDTAGNRRTDNDIRRHLKVSFLIGNGQTPASVTVRFDPDTGRLVAWTPPSQLSAQKRSSVLPLELVMHTFMLNDGGFASEREAVQAIQEQCGTNPPVRSTVIKILRQYAEPDERNESYITRTRSENSWQYGIGNKEVTE